MFQILVVEDDRALCQSVCAYLSGQGYETTGCQSAQDAYDAMYSRVFDLIVSDVMMPGTDGFEFASTVRALNQEIPILFMTARDDLASKQRGFCIGIDDYMVKPIELDELAMRIGALTLLDGVRRHHLIDKPVRRILDAAERLMQGDFSARIAPMPSLDSHNGLNEIAACFNRMAQELSGTETLRTDFIANVSHELKTPLAVIRNYATMLQAPELPQAQRLAYARVIGDTSQRLADLISNILRLGKLENQQIFPAFAEFDLSEQLCACLLSFEDAWEEKHLDIETAIEDGVRAYGDAQLLELVWNNLFSNAIKFTGCGGRVSIRLSQADEQAVVTVADTGCGFSSDVGAHIFEKFYQGDTSHATQGSGLGLALVRRVVDIHGGEIAVSSAPGRGSTFTVRIHQGGAIK